MSPKPIASLSLDLDNQWSYMKTHGDTGWQAFPSYLDLVVPRVLELLEERDLKITFFIVGKDAALGKNNEVLRAIASGGHEVGNHSFHHEPWLYLYTEPQLIDELARAEEHIERSTGQRTVGFRGPGYSISATVLKILDERGYLYDASTFPTFIGPLARAYYFMASALDAAEKQQRKLLFGTLRDGLRPLKPYRWRVGSGRLVEIPVTTMPLVRAPIHLSYLLYLRRFSLALARWYFSMAVRLCRATGTELSLLLHPLDFLGSDDGIPEIAFFPAMDLPREKKLEFASDVLRSMAAAFRVITMREHAGIISSRDKLRAVEFVNT